MIKRLKDDAVVKERKSKEYVERKSKEQMDELGKRQYTEYLNKLEKTKKKLEENYAKDLAKKRNPNQNIE